MTSRRIVVLLAVATAAALAGAVAVLLVDRDEQKHPRPALSGDIRDALSKLHPDELPTIEIVNQPGWVHEADAEASNYQVVWAYSTSPTTPYRPSSDSEAGRYLLLDPRERDVDGHRGRDEWWYVIERYWPSTYRPGEHGEWGRQVNFHNVAGDAGSRENDNGGVGWGFGSGVSALALDWLPGDPAPSLCVLCAYKSEGGANHPLPVPTRDQWHTYVVHWIAGRTDGSTARPGMVEVWVDGADTPHLRRTNVNTVQRATGNVDGRPYSQRWMVLWEGDYTSGLPVEARLRFTLTRVGGTLEEALADRPTLVGTTLGGYRRIEGSAPEPSLVLVTPARRVTEANIPRSLRDAVR